MECFSTLRACFTRQVQFEPPLLEKTPPLLVTSQPSYGSSLTSTSPSPAHRPGLPPVRPDFHGSTLLIVSMYEPLSTQVAKMVDFIQTSNVSCEYVQEDLAYYAASFGQGWVERAAKGILEGIEQVIAKGEEMGGVMTGVVSNVRRVYSEFAKEHPYLAMVAETVIAIGVLAVVAPWVLEALGFASTGPRAASFAARWMSQIAKRNNIGIPKGSLYAYLQKVGMIWKQGKILSHL